MEIPCVSTYIAGIPELITDGVEGLLVPASDAEALAGAIRRLLDDGSLRQELGRRGRMRVLATYNLQGNVAHLGELFRQGGAGIA